MGRVPNLKIEIQHANRSFPKKTISPELFGPNIVLKKGKQMQEVLLQRIEDAHWIVKLSRHPVAMLAHLILVPTRIHLFTV